MVGLRVAFRLPTGESPASLAGNLILGLDGKDEGVPIPFVVAQREFKDLTVTPDTVSLDSDDPEATVTLVGPDVVAYLRSRGAGKTSIALRDDAGDTAKATVSFGSARKVLAGESPELARGTVKLDGGTPDPGKYTGKLPLSHAFPEGPSLAVELHAHKSRVCMALWVLLGIVFGGLITRLVTTMRRRTMLLETLKANVADYSLAAKDPDQIKSWDLSDRLKSLECEGTSVIWYQHPIEWMIARYRKRRDRSGLRLLGLKELARSIETARSSTDLDEDAERVIEMVAQIQRWLRVEPVARLLANVSGETPVGSLATSAGTASPTVVWKETQTHVDTLAQLEMARREPPDAEKADDLVQRLLYQASWHHGFATAWKKAVSDPQGDIAAGLARLDKEMKDEETAIGALEADELDARNGRLRALLSSDLPTPDAYRPPNPAWRAKRKLPEVDWDASPNLFTGWATLDAPSLKQLSLRAAVTSRTRYWSPAIYVREARTLRPVDLAASLGILVVAAAAYSLTNFDDTWGTSSDLSKAFLAGLTGAAVVKWGALPIFRSARIRATVKEA